MALKNVERPRVCEEDFLFTIGAFSVGWWNFARIFYVVKKTPSFCEWEEAFFSFMLQWKVTLKFFHHLKWLLLLLLVLYFVQNSSGEERGISSRHTHSVKYIVAFSSFTTTKKFWKTIDHDFLDEEAFVQWETAVVTSWPTVLVNWSKRSHPAPVSIFFGVVSKSFHDWK